MGMQSASPLERELSAAGLAGKACALFRMVFMGIAPPGDCSPGAGGPPGARAVQEDREMREPTRMDDELQRIEDGFTTLVARIERTGQAITEASDEVRVNKVRLIRRMGEAARGVVREIGLNLLRRGKHGLKDDLFDVEYYPDRVLVLGKAQTTTARPDDPSRPVVDQFCLLSEKGVFMEIMYSSDGMITDSYRGRLSAEDALSRYGDELIFMLFRALRDYLKGQEELLAHLEATIAFISGKQAPPGGEPASPSPAP